MPCYGINFDGKTRIPENVSKKLPRLKRVGVGAQKVTLQGCCNSHEEMLLMRNQADNGVRLVYVEGPFAIDSMLWWGIWTS